MPQILRIPDKWVALGGHTKDDPGTWTDVLIMPDGKVPLAGGEVLELTEQSAARVIAAFNQQGVDVPIDVEHHTLDEDRETAPAFGWIKSLSYISGRGLVASVEWSDRGLELVDSQAYKYLSPVLLFDEAGKLSRLHSVALTNKPAIRFMESLKAASENLGVQDMPKGKSKKATPFLKTLKALQEGDAIEAPMEGEPDMGVLAGEIKTLLGIEGDDLTLPALLMAIRDKLKEKMAGEGEGDEGDEGAEGGGADAVAASQSIRDIGRLLKLKADNRDPKSVLLAFRESIATATDSTTVQALREEVRELKSERLSEKVEAVWDKYVKLGKINPNATENAKLLRELAEENIERFIKLMDSQAEVVPQGDRFENDTEFEGGSRAQILAQSIAGYKAERVKTLVTTAPVNWVNTDLSDAGMNPMTEDERAKYLSNVA